MIIIIIVNWVSTKRKSPRGRSWENHPGTWYLAFKGNLFAGYLVPGCIDPGTYLDLFGRDMCGGRRTGDVKREAIKAAPYEKAFS